MTSRPGRDVGFTLVELLVTMVVLGIVATPLAAALMTILRNADATTGRLSESHDVQITSAWFAQDVAAVGMRNSAGELVQSVETGVAATGGLAPCGTAGTPPAVLRLSADDFAAPMASGLAAPKRRVVVAYVVVTTATERQLHRLRCAGDPASWASAAAAPAVAVVAHQLTSADPAVTCLRANGAAYGCDGDGTDPVPTVVRLGLTVRDSASTADYTTTLVGERRRT